MHGLKPVPFKEQVLTQTLKPVLHRIVNVRAEARLKPVPFKA